MFDVPPAFRCSSSASILYVIRFRSACVSDCRSARCNRIHQPSPRLGSGTFCALRARSSTTRRSSPSPHCPRRCRNGSSNRRRRDQPSTSGTARWCIGYRDRSAHTAFGLSKPVAFVGAAHDQQSAALLFRNHKIGNIEVISLVDGRKIFDRAIADKIAVTGTHWLLPSVGTL